MKKYLFDDYFSADTFPITITQMWGNELSPDMALHQHEFSELVFISKGTFGHETISGSEILAEGDFFFIHPGMAHNYSSSDADTNLLFNVMFDAKLPIPMLMSSALPILSEVYPSEPFPIQGKTPEVFSVDKSAHNEINYIIQQLQAELLRNESGHSLLIVTMFMELIVRLSREAFCDVKINAHWSLNRAVAYMQKHYKEKISMRILAQNVAMSERTLLRRFKEHFGIGPAEYLIDIRLQKSIQLLSHSNLTLNTIALDCGFNDASHLWKSMKSKMDKTPSDFRSNLR